METKVICDLCQVECTGEGFFIAPDKSEFICILVRQCPECGRLVPAAGERYLSDKQRNFLLRVNEQGRATCQQTPGTRSERGAAFWRSTVEWSQNRVEAAN